MIKVHDGKVIDAIHYSEGLLLTGGRDSKIAILDPENGYRIVETIDVSKIFKEHSSSAKIRTASFTANKASLIVATFGSEVFELKLESAQGVANAFNVIGYR